MSTTKGNQVARVYLSARRVSCWMLRPCHRTACTAYPWITLPSLNDASYRAAQAWHAVRRRLEPPRSAAVPCPSETLVGSARGRETQRCASLAWQFEQFYRVAGRVVE